MSTRTVGSTAESFARDYLESKGFEIISQNYYKRDGEIDIISIIGSELVFVEVKSLKENRATEIFQTVSKKKLFRLENAVKHWLLENNMLEKPWRIDFIGIIMSNQNKLVSIEHISHVGL